MSSAGIVFLIATLAAGGAVSGVERQDTPASGALSYDTFVECLSEAPDPFARFRFLAGDEVKANPELAGFAAQMLATQYSFLGRPNDAIREFPIHDESVAPSGLPGPDAFESKPAVEWVAQQAPGFRVVMVNEAHHEPRTRLLTLALLPRLRELGFTHFAAETFGEKPLEAGYPTPDTGYYTSEPVFAELVRHAVALGFTLVPYESAGEDSQQARETGQARRLADLLSSDPAARILVHAGYGHISEAAGTQPQGADPMALELQRLTGLPVLTLDQTKLTWEDGKAAKRLAQAFGIMSPGVLLDRASGQAWSAFPGRFDASVVLPVVDATALRPDWLALDGARPALVIDMTPCVGHLPCLVEARYAGEGDDAIPADQFLVLDSGETGTPLYLAPGHYRVRFVGDDGRSLAERELVVPAAPTETPH